MTDRISFSFLIFLLCSFSLFAQTQVPQNFNYQGIARISGGILANKAISVTIEILNSVGTPIFQEVHTPTTNVYGVFNIGIGTVNAALFSNVDWYSAKKIRSSFSYSGQNVSTTDDLRSVPFALGSLYAINATNAQTARTCTLAGTADSSTSAVSANNIYNTYDAAYNAPNHIFYRGPIIIHGSVTKGNLYYGYLNLNGASGRVGPNSSVLSLIADNRIMAEEFQAFSDERIKTDITQSNNVKDIDFLKNLIVRDFKYKDSIQKGAEFKKGFIAQEVERAFPEAVNQISDFIPNIYTISKNISFDSIQKTLTVILGSLPDLKVGDKIRLISQKQYDVEVIAVEGLKFTVKDWTEKDTKKVFVYGKKVDDFRAVDYDRIFTLNVSVTQALIKENDKIKERLGVLENQNAEIIKKLKFLETQVLHSEKNENKSNSRSSD